MRKKMLATFFVLIVINFTYGSQNTANWIKYTSTEGRFSVLLPSQPKLLTQSAKAPDDAQITQHAVYSEEPYGLYMIGYFDKPAGMTYSLDVGQDAFVKANNGTLLSEKKIALDGHEGRDLLVSSNTSSVETITHAWLIDAGNIIYAIQFIHLKSADPTLTSKYDATYFDSFKISKDK
ncbi:MAG: hypothetical protein QOH25_220 [Acidobacteriota bacterium]|jgi:hypothetical protein|nr:hypothetical protein [Acidobacteriota bacterium]